MCAKLSAKPKALRPNARHKKSASLSARLVQGIEQNFSAVCRRSLWNLIEHCENEVATNGNNLEAEFDALLKRQVKSATQLAACQQFDPDTASAYLEQALSMRAQTVYEEHLVTCATCRHHIIELSRLLPPQAQTTEAVVVRASFKERWSEWMTGWRLGALAGLGTVAAAMLLVAVVVNRSTTDSSAPMVAAHRTEAQATPQAEMFSQDAPATTRNQESKPSASPAADAWALKGKAQAAPPPAGSAPSQPERFLNTTDATIGTLPPPAPTPAPGKTEGERKDEAAKQVSGAVTMENQRQNLRAVTPSGPEVNQLQAERRLELQKNEAAQAAAAAPPASAKPATKSGDKPAEEVAEKRSAELADATDRKQAQTKAASRPALARAAPRGRSVAGKTFRQENGLWIDEEYKASSNLPVVRLTPDSENYQQTLKDHPGLKPYFELKTVWVVWQGKVYRVENK
jgi:hypothetical protein